MTPREQVLANVRRSLGVTGVESPRRRIVEDRLATHPTGVIPDRAAGRTRAEQVRLFVAMAEEAAASVAVVRSELDVPGEIAGWLRDANYGPQLRSGDDPRLARLDWAGAGLAVETGRSFGDDRTCVSAAFGGVAETGTLVLHSGPDNPTTLNFLPDNHVVVVEAADLVATYEDIWARVRTRFGAGAMPRTVNWITGPSRSADIEQTLLMGAHGPKRLHIVLIDPDGHAAIQAAGGQREEPKPDAPEKKDEGSRTEQDDELDEELDESFPASDPPSSTQP